MPLPPALTLCDMMALPMIPLHLLGQDNPNDVQHDLFGDMMPLASCDADGIINHTIVFIGSR